MGCQKDKIVTKYICYIASTIQPKFVNLEEPRFQLTTNTHDFMRRIEKKIIKGIRFAKFCNRKYIVNLQCFNFYYASLQICL